MLVNKPADSIVHSSHVIVCTLLCIAQSLIMNLFIEDELCVDYVQCCIAVVVLVCLCFSTSYSKLFVSMETIRKELSVSCLCFRSFCLEE